MYVYCIQCDIFFLSVYQKEKANKIRAILRESIIEAVVSRCGCGFSDEDLGKDLFSCRTSQTSAIYRSSVIAASGTDMIGYIQDWVWSRESVLLEWFIVDVYDFCPVRISSLNDEDCQGPEANETYYF